MAMLSVLMPAYNAERYIGGAVSSILAQSFSDFELIVLDDGSEDATADVVSRMCTDRRIRLLRRDRQGQIASRNELLNCAETDIVAWADADDVSLPHRLQLQLEAMRARPEVDVLGTMMDVVDANGKRVGRKSNPIGAERVASALEQRVAVSQTSMMLKRRIALEVGYRAAYETAEDYDFLLRVKERGTLDNLDVYAVRYLANPDGVSLRQPARQLFAADLARATHRLRRDGRPDPTSGLAGPLDLNNPLLDELLPDDIGFHRAMDRAANANLDPAGDVLRELMGMSISRRRERLLQRAIVSVLRRRPFDRLSAQACMFAFRLGPGRFARLAGQSCREMWSTYG